MRGLGWNDREIQTLSYHFVEHQYRLNEVIYNTNEDADHLYFVLEGEFRLESKVTAAPPKCGIGSHQLGRQKSEVNYAKVSHLVRGDIFGEERVFGCEKRAFRVVSQSLKARAYKINFDDFNKRIWDK